MTKEVTDKIDKRDHWSEGEKRRREGERKGGIERGGGRYRKQR